MKRVYKNVLTILLILSFFFFPRTVQAASDEFYYSDIDKAESLDLDELYFDNIRFEKKTDSEFGVRMDVENLDMSEFDCEIVIKFYDEDFNLVTSNTQDVTIEDKKEDKIFVNAKLDTYYSDYTADDVVYYSVSIISTKKDYIPSTIEQEIPSKTGRYDSYDYLIDKYDVVVNVSEENVLDITETITAYFNVRKHGIYRRIPIINNVKRNDGTKSTVRAKISNITVDENYTTAFSSGYKEIKIGDEDTLLTGEKTYTIKYKYDLGRDRNVGFDEFYFNLIGTEWSDTVIGGITFSVKLPKDFDKGKAGFSHGKVGSTDSEGILYAVDGRVISGNYQNILGPGEGLTLRLELDDGYFKGSSTPSILPYIMIILPVAALVISFMLWGKYGKDDPVVETVEFYPPNGLNSLDVGFIYKGRVENKDVVSLLVYLANKGYIKISEIESKKFLTTKKTFKITKLKEYDGSDDNERIFLNGLFTSKKTSGSVFKVGSIQTVLPGEEQPDLVSVTEEDLYDNFYRTMNRITSNVNSKENKFKYFEKVASKMGKVVTLLQFLTVAIVIAIPSLEYGGLDGLVESIPCFVILALLLTIFILPVPIIIKVIFILSFVPGLVVFLFVMAPWGTAVMSEEIYLVAAIIGFASIFGIAICNSVMPKRTRIGNELLGKLRGFKRFLETAKKEQLESLVMQNPTYFYDILPYTYVLGVSDKWIKKFESIALVSPDWYDSPGVFDPVHFGTFMNSTMSSASASMSSSSDGGGSSGGGSGGGGGGSW